MGKTRDLFKKIIGVRLPVPVPVVGYKARRRAADFPFPEPVAGLGVSLLSFPRSPGLPREEENIKKKKKKEKKIIDTKGTFHAKMDSIKQKWYGLNRSRRY